MKKYLFVYKSADGSYTLMHQFYHSIYNLYKDNYQLSYLKCSNLLVTEEGDELFQNLIKYPVYHDIFKDENIQFIIQAKWI